MPLYMLYSGRAVKPWQMAVKTFIIGYRTSKRQDIDWRNVLTGFVKRFLTIIQKRGSVLGCGPKCLVVDDSLLLKIGLKGEFVGGLLNHVTHAYRIGLRLLQLCYYDGKSTIPIDFSIHREKGKVAEKPYGLTKIQLKNQHKTKRKINSISWLRAKEVDESKMDIAIKMIKRSLKFLEVDYVLMDSWFTSKRMVECVRGAIDSNKKPKAHLIGMMKMGNASFIYNGELFTNCQSLLTKLKRTIKITKCKSMNSHYVIADVTYNGYPVRLFYSRFGQRGKWHLLLSTDQSLDYEAMMKIYKIRWTIEVYFHESKSLLGLGKCQSTSIEAQIASATLAMIQYILLTLKKRFDDYET